MPDFFSRLNFSFGNEDWETEQEALQLKPTDRVLCVTGSGDRPLHLLMQECEEIVSLDANPAQTHLLELKIAAMRNLPYKDYITFLGGEKCSNRMRHMPSVSADLPAESKQFWNQYSAMVSRGILYEGKVEKKIQLLAKIARFLQGKRRIAGLFACQNLEEQREYVNKHWDRFIWRTFFNIGLHPKFSKIALRDPSLYAYVDPSIKPGSHLHHRMKVSLNTVLARDNFFMSFWLKGHVDKGAFPPYLTPEGVGLIKPRLGRIKSKTQDLIQYLESAPPNSFDCYSLSDVISYVDPDSFKRLMHAVHRTARPGARFCFRECMSRREIPEALQTHFKRNHALEQKLEEADRCFVYRFLVGTVHR